MRTSRNQSGFTLIELMIVVVIIGILALVALPRFTGVSQQARQAEAGPILKQLCQLAEADRERTGDWPAGAPSGWVAPAAQYFNFSFASGIATATPTGGGVVASTLNCQSGVMTP